MSLALSLTIDALCVVGLCAAAFMLAKAKRYERGGETEPSVVLSPRARLFGGVPNSSIGIAYYVFMLVAAWFLHLPAVWYAALAATIVAGAVSAYLAYSLLFVTRMPCRYCWTGHIVNWMLLVIVLASHVR